MSVIHRCAFLVVAASALGALPLAEHLGSVPGALFSVGVGVLLGLVASGGLVALGVAGGAIGAFVYAILAPASPALAGAALVGLAYAERTTRVRRLRSRGLHVGLALGTGAAAAGLVGAFAHAGFATQLVSFAVAAVAVGLPLLIEADDAVAHALDAAATKLPGATSAALREGAELRRTSSEVSPARAAAKQIRKTWRSLVRLAEARARIERRARVAGDAAVTPRPSAEAVRALLNQRIVEHVGALTRAYGAADTASAAHVGLDDAALRAVEHVGERLEELSEAMVETR